MNCPECNAVILMPVDEIMDGDTTECESCGENLEIVFLDGGGIVLEPLVGLPDPLRGFEVDDDDPPEEDDIEW